MISKEYVQLCKETNNIQELLNKKTEKGAIKRYTPKQFVAVVADYFENPKIVENAKGQAVKKPFTWTGLGLHIGLAPDVIKQNYKSDPLYSHIVEYAKLMIEEDIVVNASLGFYAPNFAQFRLTNGFGYSNKLETDNKHDNKITLEEVILTSREQLIEIEGNKEDKFN